MRKYSKRTKSTSRKDYKDYIQMRAELESKGYELKAAMSKEQFENFYSNRQVKVLANAASKMYNRKVTQQDIYKMSPQQITDIGAFINLTKQTGIYGGDYE